MCTCRNARFKHRGQLSQTSSAELIELRQLTNLKITLAFQHSSGLQRPGNVLVCLWEECWFVEWVWSLRICSTAPVPGPSVKALWECPDVTVTDRQWRPPGSWHLEALVFAWHLKLQSECVKRSWTNPSHMLPFFTAPNCKSLVSGELIVSTIIWRCSGNKHSNNSVIMTDWMHSVWF